MALLLVPGDPENFTLAQLRRLPLEVPLIVLALLLLKNSLFTVTRLIVTAVVLTLLVLRLGDLISQTAFGRAFNPLAEWHLIQQGWTLTATTIGKTEAVVFALAGLLLLILTGVLLFRLLGSLARLNKPWQRGFVIASVAALAAGTLINLLPAQPERLMSGKWVVAKELVDRFHYMQYTVRDQSEFTALLQSDELADSQPQFAALQGRDVIIIFVESYGRTFIDNEQFSELAANRLQLVQEETRDAGLFVKSAWVDSPIRGGRSWLAQATLASGLRLTNHARFDRLITSDRKPLGRLFDDAGWNTAAVLPVVKTPWVEGAWYQVDRFFDRDAMNYKGKGFGFLSMPDQYTLSAFQHTIRDTSDGPLMAYIGLMDSHAPWGPLPTHQSWDDIGDGSVFDGTQRFGARNGWTSAEPVRKAYGVSVDQDLKLVGEYLDRYAEDALVIVIGDHQPASIIAGWAPNAHVPMHVFSADAQLLERLPAELFTTGMMPLTDSPVLPMEDIRSLLGTSFEASAEFEVSADEPEAVPDDELVVHTTVKP